MAVRPAIQSGPLSGSTTFGNIQNTPTIHATTNITLTTALVPYRSATFTPPAGGVEACLGAYVYFAVGGYGTGAQLSCVLLEDKGPCTISNGSPCLVTFSGHGFTGYETIRFVTTGALPAPLLTTSLYYVNLVDINTFNISSTSGGTNINTTDAGSGTHTLEHDKGVLGAQAVISLTSDNVPLRDDNTWNYFCFTTPYVYINVATSLYRFGIIRGGSTSIVITTLAADGAGTAFAYMAIDNNTSALAVTDCPWIVGQNRTANTMDIGIQSNQTCGNNKMSLANRSLDSDSMISSYGKLYFDSGYTSNLTFKGVLFAGNLGIIEAGTEILPFPTGQTATLTFSMTDATGKGGLYAGYYGRIIMCGCPLSFYNTTYASGTGTVVDPLIVTDSVNWSVNDEIIFAASYARAQTETRYIVTVNSPTSYVLSTSVGGAPVGLTYAHKTGCHILNIERNVIVTSDNTLRGHPLTNYSQDDTNYSTFNWVQFEYLCTATANYNVAYFAVNATTHVSLDYCAIVRSVGSYPFNASSGERYPGSSGLTFSHNIVYGTISTIYGATVAGQGNTLNDWWFFGIIATALYVNGYNNTINRCKFIATGLSTSYPTLYPNGYGHVINDCFMEWSSCAIAMTGQEIVINNLEEYGLATPLYLLYQPSGGSYANCRLYNCSIASPRLHYVTNGGSSISYEPGTDLSDFPLRFEKINGITGYDLWMTKGGLGIHTGTGSFDSLARTGNNALKLVPYNSIDGMTWKFRIPVKVGETPNITGWVCYDYEFKLAGSARVELWYPNQISPSDTFNVDMTASMITDQYTYFNGASSSLIRADNTDFSFTDGLGNDLPFEIEFEMVVFNQLSTLFQFLVSKRNTSSQREWDIYLQYGCITVTLWNNLGSTIYLLAISKERVPFGAPVTIKITYDGSETAAGINIYFNNILQPKNTDSSVGAYAGMTNGTASLYIGKIQTSAYWANILMRNLKITKNGTLVAHYPMNTVPIGNDGSGYEVDDVLTIVGGSNDATVTILAIGDDFSNVANVVSGTINKQNCVFIATGTVPNYWGSGGLLRSMGIPIPIVLENNIGNITFSYENTGTYKIISSAAFTLNKTAYFATNTAYNLNGNIIAMDNYGDENDIWLTVYNTASAGAEDGQLVNFPIEIRVYN